MKLAYCDTLKLSGEDLLYYVDDETNNDYLRSNDGTWVKYSDNIDGTVSVDSVTNDVAKELEDFHQQRHNKGTIMENLRFITKLNVTGDVSYHYEDAVTGTAYVRDNSVKCVWKSYTTNTYGEVSQNDVLDLGIKLEAFHQQRRLRNRALKLDFVPDPNFEG